MIISLLNQVVASTKQNLIMKINSKVCQGQTLKMHEKYTNIIFGNCMVMFSSSVILSGVKWPISDKDQSAA